jgi:hypothetical protein
MEVILIQNVLMKVLYDIVAVWSVGCRDSKCAVQVHSRVITSVRILCHGFMGNEKKGD